MNEPTKSIIDCKQHTDTESTLKTSTFHRINVEDLTLGAHESFQGIRVNSDPFSSISVSSQKFLNDQVSVTINSNDVNKPTNNLTLNNNSEPNEVTKIESPTSKADCKTTSDVNFSIDSNFSPKEFFVKSSNDLISVDNKTLNKEFSSDSFVVEGNVNFGRHFTQDNTQSFEDDFYKRHSISVISQIKEIFSFNDINYTINVNDPYIEKIQNYINSLKVDSSPSNGNKVNENTTQQIKELEVAKKIEEIEHKKKVKIKEFINKLIEIILETKVARDTKKVFDEQIQKMKAVLELYIDSLKDIMEPICEDDNSAKGINDNSDEKPFIFNDRRKIRSTRGANYNQDIPKASNSSTKFVTVPADPEAEIASVYVAKI